MSVAEFLMLHNSYEVEGHRYISCFTLSGGVRVRPHRIRKDGKLEKTQDRLLFILQYLKSNALQQHAASYEMTRPHANLWIHLLLLLLKKTLKSKGELPERKAFKITGLLQKAAQVFMDGTERNIQRSSDFEEQRAHYSRKKGA